MDVQALVIETILIFFLLMGLFACALGLILMLAPTGFERLATRLNQEWSTRRAMKSLEVPRYYERFFYRYHRWAGGLLLLASLYFFLGFAFQTSPEALAARLPGMDWIWEGFFWLLVAANLLAAVLAMVILLRPSALKPLERAANHWVSVRQASRPLTKSYNQFDELARRHHRVTGFLLLLGGGFLLASYGVLLAGLLN